jgi:hypothetical protein
VSGVFATPRPIPEGKVPALGGTAVVLVALPVFLVAGWSIGAWAIAAGLVAFGRMTRAVALLAILIAVAVADSGLGFPAAIVYGLAFTVEFALSLLAYFGGEAKT